MTEVLSDPGQWLDRYGNILYRYAFARVRVEEVAEDLLQETLIAALKAQANFAGQASEQTWLIGILKHKMMDYFRKSVREQTQEFDDLAIAAVEGEYFDRKGSWQIELSTWTNPDIALEQDQFLVILHACMERLPPDMAQLFILRELDGLESEEICKIMSISTLNNLWVRLSRVRLKLRNCLDVHWFGKGEN